MRFWLEACAEKGGSDDGGLFGVGEYRQRCVLSPALPALGCVVEKRIDGWVGLALHVAVDVPEIDHGCKGHPVACAGKLLNGDCVLDACSAHERDPNDFRALGSELD